MYPKLSETLSKYSKIILVWWGTGGHVQPIINILEKGGGIRETNDEGLVQEFLWIGGKNSQEEQAARENSIEFVSIPTFKISTTRSPKILLYPFILIRGILEAREILKNISIDMRWTGGSGGETVWAKKNSEKWRAEPGEASFLTPEGFDTFSSKSMDTGIWKERIAVFSKWWPWSVAVGIAAWSLGIPLYIHESDTIPGRSNRILGKIATKIFLGFDSAKKYFKPEKCETIGQILHPVFSSLRKELSEWNEDWGLAEKDSETPIPLLPLSQGGKTWKTNKKHLLVICGSQWARAIFEEILKNLEQILRNHEVILVLGKLNMDMRSAFEEKLRILNLESWSLNLVDWISQENLAHLIPDTDIAITRGSATTLAELTSFQHSNIQLIIIPLPYSADNHQYSNALEYEKLWHTILEQKSLNQLTKTLENIWQNSQHSNI